MSRFVIQVDYECNAEAWWDAARDAIEQPYADLIAKLDSQDEIEVDETERAALIGWASRLPGWSGDASYARNPLIVRSV